jgi:hypothetical protein
MFEDNVASNAFTVEYYAAERIEILNQNNIKH